MNTAPMYTNLILPPASACAPFNLPASLTVAQSFSTETAEINGNSAGRTTNKGMEGLAITPDGSKLVGIMQANALQDKSKNVRIVVIDIASGGTQEFAYKITDGTGERNISRE